MRSQRKWAYESDDDRSNFSLAIAQKYGIKSKFEVRITQFIIYSRARVPPRTWHDVEVFKIQTRLAQKNRSSCLNRRTDSDWLNISFLLVIFRYFNPFSSHQSQSNSLTTTSISTLAAKKFQNISQLIQPLNALLRSTVQLSHSWAVLFCCVFIRCFDTTKENWNDWEIFNGYSPHVHRSHITSSHTELQRVHNNAQYWVLQVSMSFEVFIVGWSQSIYLRVDLALGFKLAQIVHYTQFLLIINLCILIWYFPTPNNASEWVKIMCLFNFA